MRLLDIGVKHVCLVATARLEVKHVLIRSPSAYECAKDEVDKACASQKAFVQTC